MRRESVGPPVEVRPFDPPAQQSAIEGLVERGQVVRPSRGPEGLRIGEPLQLERHAGERLGPREGLVAFADLAWRPLPEAGDGRQVLELLAAGREEAGREAPREAVGAARRLVEQAARGEDDRDGGVGIALRLRQAGGEAPQRLVDLGGVEGGPGRSSASQRSMA